jgi:cysteinyl-tRNA synthetase
MSKEQIRAVMTGTHLRAKLDLMNIMLGQAEAAVQQIRKEINRVENQLREEDRQSA